MGTIGQSNVELGNFTSFFFLNVWRKSELAIGFIQERYVSQFKRKIDCWCVWSYPSTRQRHFGWRWGSRLLVGDLNAGKWIAYSQTQGTIHNERRQSTAKNFLISAAERSNLYIITNAVVREIEIENGEAIGVRFTYNGARQIVARNRKEVILSAGAIASPQVLMLSGIGPKSNLEQLGVPVKKELPAVSNFHDHAAVHLFIQFNSIESNCKAIYESLDNFYELAVHNSQRVDWNGLAKPQCIINNT